MSVRSPRALEPIFSTSRMSQTVDRRLEQQDEVAAAMVINEPMLRFQVFPRARQHLPSMPEGTGIEIHPGISDYRLYNNFLGGVDQQNATRAPCHYLHVEDVLR